MEVTCGGVRISLDAATLQVKVEAKGVCWSFAESYRPHIQTDEGDFAFTEARSIEHHLWKTGVGEGVRSTFRGFVRPDGTLSPMAFETVVWAEETTGSVFFELLPLEESGRLKAAYWPGPMEFTQDSQDWYSVLNVLQGLIMPNNWPVEVNGETNKINFSGQFCSTAAYMPWWGQVCPEGGYMAICVTPWDGAYDIDHPKDGPYTHVSPRWLESLGKLSYRRIYEYRFFAAGCDYNDLCKSYRMYAKEKGLLVTLREKAARCAGVDKLIGCAIVHKGIKTHISPDSRHYDPEHPEKMDTLTPFSDRTAQIKKLKAAGLEKVYLHLDGWGDPGYDNKHPDYLPPCEAAGGWAGMKELSDTMQECGYMFGIHDQYRDYYLDAPTYDENFACLSPDGTVYKHAIWAGGWQSLLCASQAPFYVKRNFEELFRHGIHLEATYLDVFTCNEGDECVHPWHRMSRKECFEYRKSCFDYLLSRDIVPSSEEVVDWSMQSLVFAHYGPYDFMLCRPDAPKKGVPTPLFNLVYHDCVILPWLMDRTERDGDYMLYALLNGGAAYLDCEAEGEALDEEIRRYRTVAKLQEKVAKCEMVRHEFLDKDFQKERAVYSDGTAVTIDHAAQSYTIEEK